MAEYSPSKIIKDGNTYNFRDTTKIPLAGSNQISGSLIPATTNAYDLGSSSYQWNNLYAKNYFYNGTAWGLDQANVWNTYQTIKGYYFGNEQSTNGRTCLYLTSNRDTVGQSGIYITKFRQNRAQGAMNPADLQFITFDVLENSIRTNGVLQLNITNWNADGDVPSGAVLFSNLSDAQLGSSLIPWKTLNGINPGALSLPSSTYINVDTTNWDVAGGTNVYTPPANGWLHIRVVGATELMVRWTGWGFGDRRVSATATDLGVTIPVVAGVTVDVVTVASGFDGKCQFFPCQGNV